MIDLDQELDLNSTDADDFLSGIQGNIIKGHGRNHTTHVFVTFPAETETVKKWIAEFAANHVTSAAKQLGQSKAWRASKDDGETFACFLLSHQGYAALGVPEREIPDDPFFRAGLKQHNSVGQHPINDPAPVTWDQGFRGDLHAMVLLADDDRGRLDKTLDNCSKELEAIGCAHFVERGKKLEYNFGPPRGTLEIEHFGHQDGVSNPRMIKAAIEKEKNERGAKHWDPSAPLGLTLVKEPAGNDRYGSYMVFRKLEQNVRAFHQARNELAKLLQIDADGAAGLMVGRHRDGTPAIPTTTTCPDADPNDFTFAPDRPEKPNAARLCPFHSHIRRTNPRGDIPHYGGPSFEFERSMRIARRGITYGERPDLYNPDTAAKPETGVGLLFMSFQGQIQQFAIQQAGSDGDTFPYNFDQNDVQFTGLESVTGQPADPSEVRPQPWPCGDPEGNEIKEFRMMNFVKMLGGEYFFAPSLTYLKEI